MRWLIPLMALCGVAASTACGGSFPPGSRPKIVVVSLTDRLSPYVIEVQGFADADLARVRGASLSVERMQALMRVTLSGGAPNELPVTGRYTVEGGGLRFSPLYPLAMGHDYDVIVDPSVIAGMSFAGIVRSTVTIR